MTRIPRVGPVDPQLEVGGTALVEPVPDEKVIIDEASESVEVTVDDPPLLIPFTFNTGPHG